MIRLIYVLRRLPNLSLEEFQTYWRDNHGPLVAKHSTAMAIRRYVQVHTLDDPMNQAIRESRGLQDPYDGVAELWWDNKEEAFEASATPEGQAAASELLEDERQFIDFSRSSLWFATDIPQINPTPENFVATERNTIIKLFYVFHRLPNLSREEAHLYWRMNHGPLIRKHAQAARILRYIQVHTLDDPVTDLPRGERGEMEPIYDGHAELWYDRMDLVEALSTPERQRAGELFRKDEENFIDFSRSAMWIGKEHVFVDRW
jgi:uncharacterized protein (TIGR02118 family)